MSIFCYKKIDTEQCLSWELKEARAQQQLSLEEVSKATRIPLKYLEAFENNRFLELPKATAHQRAYLRQLCQLYKIDFNTAIYKFSCDGGLKNTTLPYLQEVSTEKLRPLSLLIRNLSLTIFVLFFISYLGWQIHGIMTPPKLIVYSPIEGQISNRTEITVQGETDKENHLLANGQEIKVNEQGKFNDIILLANGVNTITLSTAKKHCKTTTVVRHVVVSIKEPAKVSIGKNLGSEVVSP